MKIRFDVNDAALRTSFIKAGIAEALRALVAERSPQWGSLTAAQMVEHLLWGFEISTGRVTVPCSTSEEWQRKARRFLNDNSPMPRGFENPLMKEGAPPLRFETLAAASYAVEAEGARFLELAESDPHTRYVHPVFGPSTVEEWSRIHFKHAIHHLLQFDLVETEDAP